MLWLWVKTIGTQKVPQHSGGLWMLTPQNMVISCRKLEPSPSTRPVSPNLQAKTWAEKARVEGKPLSAEDLQSLISEAQCPGPTGWPVDRWKFVVFERWKRWKHVKTMGSTGHLDTFNTFNDMLFGLAKSNLVIYWYDGNNNRLLASKLQDAGCRHPHLWRTHFGR